MPETGSANITAAPDVTAGRGDFPFALPFQRTLIAKDQRSGRDSWFQTAYNGPQTQYDTMVTQATAVEAGEPIQLGGGWTHNYAIILNAEYGNAALALGNEQASDASTAIAGIQSLLDLATIGTPQAKLAASYQAANIVGAFLHDTYTVSGGGLNDTFTMRKCGAPVIPRRGSSSKLSLALCGGQGSSTQYVTGDGTTYYFTCAAGEIDKTVTTTDAQLQASSCGGDAFAPAVLQKIVYPSGLAVNLSYRWDVVMHASSPTRCYFNGCDTPRFQPIAKDLRSISNSLGRSLSFNVNGLFDGNGYPTGFRITSVTTDSGATATYSVPCANNLTCDSFTVTNAANETYRYEYTADSNSPDPSIVQVPNYRVRRIFVPTNQSSPYLNVAYDSRLRVASVTDANNHVKSTYAGALFSSENWKPADVVDGNGNRTSLRFNDDGHQIQSTDALGNTSQNIYDATGQLLRTIAPEGNAVEYTYDVRGNQLTQCAIGKGRVNWSAFPLGQRTPQCSTSAGDLLTTTVYMEGPTVRADQCANSKTCNKPQYVIDPKGNRTNYTYCAPSNPDCTIDTGQVRRITTGLNSSGACAIGSTCPVTIYGYSPFTGSDGATFYLLTSKTEQIDATHSTVTTYGYNSSNKFVLREVVADAGGLNLRTCFTFDSGGNLISKTEPNAGLASCP
jgi:YD repeat-containing protein